MRLETLSKNEREVVIEVVKEIETLALKYELKQPKNLLGGF